MMNDQIYGRNISLGGEKIIFPGTERGEKTTPIIMRVQSAAERRLPVIEKAWFLLPQAGFVSWKVSPGEEEDEDLRPCPFTDRGHPGANLFRLKSGVTATQSA